MLYLCGHVINFQLPLSGSPGRLGGLKNFGFSRNFQLPLSGSLLLTLGQLERGTNGTFNSLSRDHKEIYDYVRKLAQPPAFQLPLSGSLEFSNAWE